MPCEGSGLLRRDETSRLRICRLIFNWFTPDYLSHARRVAHNVSQLRLRAQFIVSPKSKVQSVSWPLLAELTEWLLSVCIAQGPLYKASQPRARPDPVMMRTMMMAMVITMSSSRISNQCHWEGSWEVVRVIKAGFRSTSASFVHCVHFTPSFASHFVRIAILIIIITIIIASVIYGCWPSIIIHTFQILTILKLSGVR